MNMILIEFLMMSDVDFLTGDGGCDCLVGRDYLVGEVRYGNEGFAAGRCLVVVR
jgi:hypothetical protein